MRIEAQAAAGDHGDEHLHAIQVAAEKRSRKLMMNLKRELSGVFTASGVGLEQQVKNNLAACSLLLAACCSLSRVSLAFCSLLLASCSLLLSAKGQPGLPKSLTRNNLLLSSAALTPMATATSTTTSSPRGCCRWARRSRWARCEEKR